MTMCCPISPADDDPPSAFKEQVRRARKPHTCCECGETIPARAQYEHASGIWDGRPDVYKTCLSCVEIRDHFACNGFYYGQIWQDIYDNFFPGMKCGGPCMEGLSPAAKALLIDKRMAWLFDDKPEVNGAPPPWHPPLADPPDEEPPMVLNDPYWIKVEEKRRAEDDKERIREIRDQRYWMFPELREDDDFWNWGAD